MYALMGLAILAVVMAFVAGMAWARRRVPSGLPTSWINLPRNKTHSILSRYSSLAWVVQTNNDKAKPVNVAMTHREMQEAGLRFGSLFQVRDVGGIPQLVEVEASIDVLA